MYNDVFAHWETRSLESIYKDSWHDCTFCQHLKKKKGKKESCRAFCQQMSGQPWNEEVKPTHSGRNVHMYKESTVARVGIQPQLAFKLCNFGSSRITFIQRRDTPCAKLEIVKMTFLFISSYLSPRNENHDRRCAPAERAASTPPFFICLVRSVVA